ncbi:MAG: hypothetical protein ACSLFK_13240 [Gemmatimonadaceae bacterium]
MIAALIGIFLIYDALSPEGPRPYRERRRRQRAEINVSGELFAGFGTLCLAGALFGGDQWRWTTVLVITGTLLIILGGILNRAFLREMLFFRGSSRRTEEHETQPVAHKKEDEPRLRIR